ncbi:MAG: acyltransferase [Desulfobacter sp.]|nr:MAG: acyltransferase [Desulfobacter sp.]
MNDSPVAGQRISFIDAARFYAMVLVYYGHIVEQVMYLGSSQAAAQYKFIYSFHMPLFFFLSGTIVADRKLALAFGRFAKQALAARLAPYILFSILLGLLSLFIPGWFPLGALTDAHAYLKGISKTLTGFPAFCIPLWFMALLISVEFFHYILSKIIKKNLVLAFTAALLYWGGYTLNHAHNFVAQGQAYWFINEAPVVYLFYAAGTLLQKSGWLERVVSQWITGLGAVLCLFLVFFTFDLNQGPFRIIQAVVIVLSAHGSFFLFPFTAFAGSFFILFAARTGPAWAWISYMGKNALSLFCLNGLFYHFVNPKAAKWFSASFELTHGTILAYSSIMTLVSIVLCIPMIYLLTTWLPQFMGKPATKGPILGPLIRP